MASTGGNLKVVTTPATSRGWFVRYVKRAGRWVRLG